MLATIHHVSRERKPRAHEGKKEEATGQALKNKINPPAMSDLLIYSHRNPPRWIPWVHMNSHSFTNHLKNHAGQVK
jgi:hypothetical protein